MDRRVAVVRQGECVIADAGAGITEDDIVATDVDLHTGGVGTVGSLQAARQQSRKVSTSDSVVKRSSRAARARP